jgi:Zn-dependent protease with chaperone function
MIRLKAQRYDGTSSARTAVELTFTDNSIHVQAEGLSHDYPYADVSLQPRLAGMPAQLRFTDDSLCEVAKQENLDAALLYIPGHSGNRFIHALENNLKYIILTLIASAAVLFALIQYGVPVMAREVAHRIPIEVETDMGKESLRFLDHLMKPSELTTSRQAELREKFQQLADSSQVDTNNILFRKGDEIGANAFALPSGIIVFTDEIVAMAKDDRELIAVFAHELAHVKYRHTMQHVLQNSATGLLVILLTGDIGTASTLAAAIPTLLVQSKFSRNFEAEADDYAVQLLTQENISPVYLGDILQRMEEKAGDNVIPGFLLSHPSTPDRIKKFQHAVDD